MPKKQAKASDKPLKPIAVKKPLKTARKPAAKAAEINPKTKAAPSKDVAKAGTSPAKPLAKSGKRSVKALSEAQDKKLKEERKSLVMADDKLQKAKLSQKPPRTRLERMSKKYREAFKQIDSSKSYNLEEALNIVHKTSPTKFDASVELHVRLNVDPKQADQNIRDTIVLPNGSGKVVRVAVFADEADAAKALKAGADLAGNDDFLAKLEKGELNFDVLISTPAAMPRLSKFARVLGPKGLMPNPKSGTVTTDVAKATTQAKAGRVEYRVDPTGIIHLSIGKVSFGDKKLAQNAQTVLDNIRSNKPSSVKGVFVSSVYLATSMGPSVRVSL